MIFKIIRDRLMGRETYPHRSELQRTGMYIKWPSGMGRAGSIWNNICWSPELSLYVATSGTENRVMTSLDGINWTLRVTP